MRDLTEVDPVLEHQVECPSGKHTVPRNVPSLTEPLLTSDPLPLKVDLEIRNTSFSEVCLKDLFDPV